MSKKALGTSLWIGLFALGLSTLAGCRRTSDGGLGEIPHPSRRTLTAFRSEGELSKYLTELSAKQRRPPSQAPADTDGSFAQPSAAPEPEATESKTAEESVTNTQHAGVDEGGIVKLHGDHLVVLRRGRLFTVRVSGDSLDPISVVDAFGPDIDPSGTWYDEMLVSDDTVVVIGYSYERGGTEIGLFDLTGSGRLSYRATYHLRSNDYYSSRNYASRLIGSKLVFYSPLYLSLGEDDPFRSFPALRKWRKGAKDTDFRRIASATRVYRPLFDTSSLALHTVTVCDLARRELDCQATAVMGPSGRVFYVSPSSVYVWTTDWESESGRNAPRAAVYRMPLDGSAPSVLLASGSPVDQFSFLESGDGFLNVVVRADADGDGMWNAEVTAGDIALLRVRLESFSDGADRAPRSAYTSLPKPSGYTFQNRFVGDWLLYGTGNGWGAPEERGSTLFAHRFARGGRTERLKLPHGVDRIEALGADAIAIGTDGKDLSFSPVALGSRPALGRRYTKKDASQGELRSHGFFYKALDARSGLLGLPVAESGRPGYEHLTQGSASVLFLRNDSLRLSELGALGAHPETAADDGCRASCVDWYGNARPLFLKGRVFALLGYELVEGRLSDGRIREQRRVSFAPNAPKIAR